MINILNSVVTQTSEYAILTSNWQVSWVEISIVMKKTIIKFFIAWNESLDKYWIKSDDYLKFIYNYTTIMDELWHKIKIIQDKELIKNQI